MSFKRLNQKDYPVGTVFKGATTPHGQQTDEYEIVSWSHRGDLVQLRKNGGQVRWVQVTNAPYVSGVYD